MRILAADIGFGYTKATDGRHFQAFKSIVGEANPAAFDGSLLPGSDIVLPRHFEVGGEAVFVGELAETQSRERNFTLDPQQFLGQYAKVLGLASLAPLVEHGDPVRLVTGLPISLFRQHRENLAQSLMGRHTVAQFHHGQREEKMIYIEKARVIPQPFGSLYNLMLNAEGRPIQQRFINEKVGVIDVGFRTCDFAIADKTRYSERGSLSTDSGICTAYEAISNWLKEKSGVAIELYRLYEAINVGFIKIRGQRYELEPLVQRAFGQLSTRIATEANRLWAEDWDIDLIVLSGGGGAVLAPFLQPQISGEVLPVPSDQDARLNNVRGYWKYGLHVWGLAQAQTQQQPG